MVSGPRGSSSPDLQERDEFWRTLSCAALGQKAALLYHTHEDKMKIKGALGENGEAGKQLSIGRATLQPGHTVEMLLGGKPWLQVPIKVCLPGEKGETEMEVIVCKREDVQETPYFKEQRWTEEEADGMSRLELYSGVPFTIQPTDFYITANQQVLQYEMRKYRGNQDVTVEHSRLLMNNNGKGYVRVLFIMASPTGFGDLPGSVKLHNGDLKNKCEVELQYASIKPRHRCFIGAKPGGFCTLTSEHDAGQGCSAKNNDCNNKFAKAPASRSSKGAASAVRRADARAYLQPGAPQPSMMPPGPPAGLMHRGNHEREGQMRHGQGKRPAEGEGSQQGPPALRDEPMQK